MIENLSIPLFMSIPMTLLLLFCLVISFVSSIKTSVYLFLGGGVIGLFGFDILPAVVVVASCYAIGFWSIKFITNRKEGFLWSFLIGYVILYIPIYFFSVVSNSGLIKFRLPIIHKILFSDPQVLLALIFLVSSISFFSILKFERVLFSEIFTFKKLDYQFDRKTIFLLYIIISIFMYAKVPSFGYDDLAIHTYIQNGVRNGNYPSFDISVNVWSYSQWISNMYYGLVSSFTRSEGRTILNLVYGIFIALSIISILIRKFSLNISLFITALVFSTPIFAYGFTSSQTEMLSTLLMVFAIYSLLTYDKYSFSKLLLLFAFSVAIKPSNLIMFGGLFFISLFFEVKNNSWHSLYSIRNFLSFLISLFIASGVYVFSFIKTGNPVFPLFNGFFLSSGFPPVNFTNQLYLGNFDYFSLYGIIFETSKYFESKNGVAGFQLLLLPIVIVCLPFLYSKYKKETVIFIVVVFSSVMMFYSQQYVRYIVPAIVAITILTPMLLIGPKLRPKNNYILFCLTLLTTLLIFNVINIPNSSWYLGQWNNWFAPFSFKKPQRDNVAPIYQVNDFLNSLRGNVKVVYPYQKPYAGFLKGEYIYLNWYNPEGETSYSSGYDSLKNFIFSQKATHLVLLSGIQDTLRDIANNSGTLVYQNVIYDVYELKYENKLFTPQKNFYGNFKENQIDSFIVDSANFAVFEYENLGNITKFNLTYVYECTEKSSWKDYLEFNRSTNFTNFIRISSCTEPNVKKKYSFDFLAPFSTQDIRVFLQPFSGEYKIYSVTLKEADND